MNKENMSENKYQSIQNQEREKAVTFPQSKKVTTPSMGFRSLVGSVVGAVLGDVVEIKYQRGHGYAHPRGIFD